MDGNLAETPTENPKVFKNWETKKKGHRNRKTVQHVYMNQMNPLLVKGKSEEMIKGI